MSDDLESLRDDIPVGELATLWAISLKLEGVTEHDLVEQAKYDREFPKPCAITRRLPEAWKQTYYSFPEVQQFRQRRLLEVKLRKDGKI